MNGQFNLNQMKDVEEAQYIVLDDFKADDFHQYKSFIGAQKEFDITDKYKGKVHVEWGKPCIWLSNDEPSTYLWDQNWLAKNSVTVHVDWKLYVPRELGIVGGGGQLGGVQAGEAIQEDEPQAVPVAVARPNRGLELMERMQKELWYESEIEDE